MRTCDSLYIKAEFLAGTDIKVAVNDICEMSKRLGCRLQASFNGVTLLANPESNPAVMAEQWDHEMASDKPYKYASGVTR